MESAAGTLINILNFILENLNGKLEWNHLRDKLEYEYFHMFYKEVDYYSYLCIVRGLCFLTNFISSHLFLSHLNCFWVDLAQLNTIKLKSENINNMIIINHLVYFLINGFVRDIVS